MTDLTKYRSSYNPWILGFPSLSASPENRQAVQARVPSKLWPGTHGHRS